MTRRMNLIPFALLVAACGAPEPRPELRVDCQAADEQFEFRVLHTFDLDADVAWFGVTDKTPGAEVGVDNPDTPTIDHNPVVEEIEDVPEQGPQEEGRCGHTSAGVFRARGFSDWGAFFADYSTVNQQIGEVYEGISFWARTASASDRSFFFVVDNAWTAVVVDAQAEDAMFTEEELAQNLCVPEIKDEDGDDSGEYPPGTDPAETCGNQFSQAVTTTAHWQLFTLPFSEFVQDRARPNVRPEGLDPTVKLVRLSVRFAVETDIELYMDEVGLYRRWEE